MTEHRPDTDERSEPAGTPSTGPNDLTARPVTPGDQSSDEAEAVPGAYEADGQDQANGRAAEPGS